MYEEITPHVREDDEMTEQEAIELLRSDDSNVRDLLDTLAEREAK